MVTTKRRRGARRDDSSEAHVLCARGAGTVRSIRESRGGSPPLADPWARLGRRLHAELRHIQRGSRPGSHLLVAVSPSARQNSARQTARRRVLIERARARGASRTGGAPSDGWERSRTGTASAVHRFRRERVRDLRRRPALAALPLRRWPQHHVIQRLSGWPRPKPHARVHTPSQAPRSGHGRCGQSDSWRLEGAGAAPGCRLPACPGTIRYCGCGRARS